MHSFPRSPLSPPLLSRRQWLAGAAALGAAGATGLAWSQPGARPGAARPPVTIAQFADMSAEQQDVSRDFLNGSRAAWQELNLHGGLQGHAVQHLTIELDGSTAALAAAWRKVQALPGCIAVCGTTGHAMASDLAELMRTAPADAPLAHVAPWLQNSGTAVDANTFPIFAGRQEQIAHAIRTLSVVGISEIGAVYASARDQAQYRADVERSAAALGLGLRSVRLDAGPLPAPGSLPAVVLFIGGTPELLRFCQGLDRGPTGRQQFVIALADVNLQTLAQAGMPRSTPVIATQPVPVVTAGLPVVRAYREALSRLFDEAPTALGLAGFIGARYAQQVLGGVNGTLDSAAALAAFRRRDDVDVGGFRVSFDSRRRGSGYVTQSMLTPDGRLLG